MRLLLIEDDKMLGASVKKALESQAYGVDWMQDAESGLLALESSPYAAIILDINLPKMSGLEFLRAIRAQKNKIPVLVLTARDTSGQKVEGLDSGADDYLIKPFDLEEFLARLRALVRRSEGRTETTLRSRDVELSLADKTVMKGNQPVMLTAKEYRILKVLMERIGRFVTKSDIEYTIYSAEDAAESNAVEVSIYNLRKKLGSDFIQTIRGVGYMVSA